MLWNLIRDFFVEHVFGGYASNGEYFSGLWGVNNPNGVILDGNDNALAYQIGLDIDGNPVILEASDWLSTTATIITITLIVIACALFVYKIIRTIGGLIR